MAEPGTYRVFITGRPGIGKSTLFNKIVDLAKKAGCRVGGITAPEVRESGRRVGFLLVDLMSGKSVVLASVYIRRGPRVGRYTVNPEAGVFGSQAVERALREADIVAIDEIGPMELLLAELRSAIVKALKSDKPLLAVVHARLRSRDPEVYSLVAGRGLIIELTEANRGAYNLKAGEYATALAASAGCRG